MAQYIDKSALVAEIEKRIKKHEEEEKKGWVHSRVQIVECEHILSDINTLEVKEVDLTDKKINWSPSKKQMESLKDMLKWNIGDFNYQKWMEVNSLYEDLTKISAYEIDR